jgi:hypothetical protein
MLLFVIDAIKFELSREIDVMQSVALACYLTSTLILSHSKAECYAILILMTYFGVIVITLFTSIIAIHACLIILPT